MTQVTITVAPADALLLAGLHRAGSAPAQPLPNANHGETVNLVDGVFHVSVAGSGMEKGTIVGVTCAASNSLTRTMKVDGNGHMAGFFPFELQGETIS